MSKSISPLQSGAFLLRQISEKRLTAAELTNHQRVLCVQYMLHEQKWTQMEIAEIVGVHRHTVMNIKHRLRKHAVMSLDVIDQRSVAIGLIETAEVACARLMLARDEAAAWKIQKELVEMLQTLGFIGREPIRFEGKLTLKELMELVHKPGNAADVAAEEPGKLEPGDPRTGSNGFHQNGSHPSLEESPEP